VEFRDNKEEEKYSKISHRDNFCIYILVLVICLIVLVKCLSVICFSIYGFATDQFIELGGRGSWRSRAEYPTYFWIANLTWLLIGVLSSFYVGRFPFLYRKKMQKTVSNQIKSLQEIDIHKHFPVSSDVENNIQSESEAGKIPLIAKAVFAFFLFLLGGIVIFSITVLCKSYCNSPIEILGLVLFFGGLAVLLYFIVLGRSQSWKTNEKGERLVKNLTTTEQIIAVAAIISFCLGLCLWSLY